MKKYVVVLATLVCFGCAHKNLEVKAPEVVASCFGDGEKNQELCKAERVNDENKIVTTRCIGTQNRNALASLRGKCVEKICSQESNTDCQIRGEIAVLDQYSELVRHRYFDDEEGASGNQSSSTEVAKTKSKKGKGKKTVKAEVQELDVDPTAKLPKLPTKDEPVAKKAAPKPAAQAPVEPAPINVTLKVDTAATAPAAEPAPAAKVAAAPKIAAASVATAAKGRKPASVSGASETAKKGCASKKKDGKSARNAKCLVRAKS